MTGSPSIETQHGHPGIVLATLSLANVMALLDLFVVNVALHDIGVGLDCQSSLSGVAWVLNAYGLFFGALLIPARRFADMYGRKATFILGLARVVGVQVGELVTRRIRVQRDMSGGWRR